MYLVMYNIPHIYASLTKVRISQCAKEKKNGGQRKKEKETHLSSSVSAAWIPFVATLPPLGQLLRRGRLRSFL